MIKTQLLVQGLALEGWQPVLVPTTGKTAYAKHIPLKSGDYVQAFMFVGGNATLRMALEQPHVTKARAMPKKAELLIAKARTQYPASLLNELEGI